MNHDFAEGRSTRGFAQILDSNGICGLNSTQMTQMTQIYADFNTNTQITPIFSPVTDCEAPCGKIPCGKITSDLRQSVPHASVRRNLRHLRAIFFLLATPIR